MPRHTPVSPQRLRHRRGDGWLGPGVVRLLSPACADPPDRVSISKVSGLEEAGLPVKGERRL